MKWNDQLATGHQTIDEQHRELIQCLKELELATLEQRTLLAVYCITRLKHNVRNHFATEEAVLRESGFPDLQEHIRQHQEFSASLLEFQVKSIQQDVSIEMVEFLAEQITRHILDSDLKYIPYLKGKRYLQRFPCTGHATK